MTSQDIKTLTEIITNTQNQLSEQLTEFKSDIDRRLERIESRLDRNETRMDRLEGNQDRLRKGQFDLMTKQEALAAAQREFTKKQDRASDVLDGIAGRITEDDTERVALSAQVTRLEDWAVETAPVVGVEYTPGA